LETIRKYYHLTKPGIIRGNLITASAGYFLASKGDVSWWILLASLIGIALIIACGCVLNNFIDINIDKKMERTKKRATVTGEVSARSAAIFATLLGLIGIYILIAFVNVITVALGFIGLVFYVVVYGIAKRKSVHGTLIGSISGAIPPVAGYTAASGSLDLAALLLFVVLTAWQMPHFYAIAIYRLADYKKAGIPVLPAISGIDATVRQIIAYVFVYIIATCLLYIYGYANLLYLIAVLVSGLFWFKISLKGLKSADKIKWAHSVFGVSLIVLLVFSVAVSVSSFMM
jgi:protoheme IX farnesyltransferase